MQETVWSLLKRAFYKRLYRLDKDLRSQDEFKELLRSVMREVHFCSASLMRVNKRYVEEHAGRRHYEEDDSEELSYDSAGIVSSQQSQ